MTPDDEPPGPIMATRGRAPPLDRRRLASTLQSTLRENKGMRAADASRQPNTSRAGCRRSRAGERADQGNDVKAPCSKCTGPGESIIRPHVRSPVAVPKQRGWWHPYHDVIAGLVRSTSWVWSPTPAASERTNALAIPGLLQTEAYARGDDLPWRRSRVPPGDGTGSCSCVSSGRSGWSVRAVRCWWYIDESVILQEIGGDRCDGSRWSVCRSGRAPMSEHRDQGAAPVRAPIRHGRSVRP